MPHPLLSHAEVTDGIRLLEAWLETRLRQTGQPGLSIGIVHDQDLVWSRGFGFANVERARAAGPDTLYRIASNTKMFTATAILHLRDAGSLSLDDPVERHLSWFRLGGLEAGSPVRIRHLLTHTAGLPREAAFPYWTDARFPAPDEVREALTEQQLTYPPETLWKYSNLGLAIAGEIVAKVSGEPYADYLARHVLEPLGMKGTFVHSPPADHASLAQGYRRGNTRGTRDRAPFTDAAGITAAAGMTSNVEDLARFVSLQLRDGPSGGAQVLAGTTLREMHRVHWLHPSWTSGWGLGFGVNRTGGRTRIGHGGAVEGHRTSVDICPDEKLGAVVLTNADDAQPSEVVEQVYRLVAPAIANVTRTAAEPIEIDPAWRACAGTYSSAWGELEVLVLADGLSVVTASELDLRATRLRLEPVPDAPDRFRMEGDLGIASIGEQAVFERDAGGGVVRLRLGDNYWRRNER